MTAPHTVTRHRRHVTAVVLIALYALLLLSGVGLTVVGQRYPWSPSGPPSAPTAPVGPGSAVGHSPHDAAGSRP